YLVGESEGRNGLDALRAAERIAGSGVSVNSPVGISGYSQGGQAAAWAAELQPSYAPEQHLQGVLAGGTPTDMLLEVNHLNGNPTRHDEARRARLPLPRHAGHHRPHRPGRPALPRLVRSESIGPVRGDARPRAPLRVLRRFRARNPVARCPYRECDDRGRLPQN